MGFLSGARKGGSTKKPKGRERDKCVLAKTRAVRKKFINEGQRKGKIGPRARAQSVVNGGETKSSSGVTKIDILQLRLSWGLDARGCRLLLRCGIVP